MNEVLRSETIYNKVDKIRKERGWTFYQLAKKAGLTENAFYRWRDKKSSPTLYLLEAIADAFEISVINLLLSDDDLAALTEDQKSLIQKWSTLKDDQKKSLLDLIETFQRNN